MAKASKVVTTMCPGQPAINDSFLSSKWATPVERSYVEEKDSLNALAIRHQRLVGRPLAV